MLRGVLLVLAVGLVPLAAGFVPGLRLGREPLREKGVPRCTQQRERGLLAAAGKGSQSNLGETFSTESSKKGGRGAGAAVGGGRVGEALGGAKPEEGFEERREERENISDITGAEDLAELLALCQADQGAFPSPERTAQSFQRLKEFRRQRHDFTPDEYKAMKDILAILDQHAMDSMESFIPRHMAMLLHCHAAMGKNPEKKLFDAFERQTIANRKSLKPQNIANILWACATLNRQPSQPMFFEICKSAEDVMNGFSPKEIANLIWALARLNRPPSPYLFRLMCEHAGDVMDGFKPQGMSIFMWACAKLSKRPPDDFFDKICSRADEKIGDFKPQEIANFMWGCATLWMPPPPALFDKVCGRAEEVAGRFKPQEIANFLWACARLGLQPTPAVFTAICDQAEAELHNFRPQGISNLMWASVTLKRRLPDTLFDGFGTRTQAMLGEFNTQEIANYMWACAAQGTRPSYTLMSKMCDRAASLIQEFKPQGIAGLLWSWATLGMQPPDSLFTKLCQRAGETIGEFNSQAIANFIWSCAVCDHVPEGLEFLLRLRSRVGLNASSFDSWDDVALCQAHQFILSYSLEPCEGGRPRSTQEFMGMIRKAIRVRCMQSFRAELASPSRLQLDVAATVKQLGFQFEEDVFDGTSGYCIDILVNPKNPQARIAMEVDGPSRFLRGGHEATGATLLKRRHLKLLGYRIVCVPYWEWNAYSGKEKEDYIKVLLTVKPAEDGGAVV